MKPTTIVSMTMTFVVAVTGFVFGWLTAELADTTVRLFASMLAG
jgi:hypothetical protein